MKKQPFYQKFFARITWILMGFVALGTLLDAFSNAIALITTPIAIVISLVIILAWLLIQIYLRFHPLTWITKNGTELTVSKLGKGIQLPLLGMILLLWSPILIGSYYSARQPVEPLTNKPVLSLEPAKNDEILILISNFSDQSDNQSFDAAGRIKNLLDEALANNDLSNVRVERVTNHSFKLDELEKVKTLGNEYNATIFIWGHYDDFGIFPRFTLLQEERVEVKLEEPQGCLTSLATPPDDLVFYINRDLPSQLTFLTEIAIGRIFLLEGTYVDALELFEDATESDEFSKEAQMRSNLAHAYFWKGYIFVDETPLQDYDQAINSFNKTIELIPDYPHIYFYRGNVFYDLKAYTLAIADYTKATELNPEHGGSFYNLGNIYLFQQDYNLAIANYKKTIDLEPTACAYHNLGFAYNQLGEYEEAISNYNSAIEADLYVPGSYFERGFAYHNLGNFDQSIADYDRALKLQPDWSVKYLNFRGDAYREMGNLEQAIRDYSKAIEIGPSVPPPYYGRGVAYMTIGNSENAIRDFEHYLKIRPNAPEREEVLRLIERLQSEYK